MATVKVMLNTDRTSVSGLYPLVIRVIHNRRKKLIYSHYRMRESNFDQVAEKAVFSGDSPIGAREIERINRYIETERNRILRIIQQLERQTGNHFSVVDIICGSGCTNVDRYLLSFIEREAAAKERANNFSVAALYRTTGESVKRFTGGRNILFNEITYKFLYDYIDHLSERGLERNTIHMYLRNLRLIYNKARKMGAVTTKISPFADIKMNGTETVKRSLTKDMMRKIAYADLSSNPVMEQARDIFLFSYYTRGMSLVDMIYLKHSDIKNGVVYYSRNKTKQHLQVTVTAPLQLLINKYTSSSVYVLPCLAGENPKELFRQYRNSVWRINRHLKEIGTLLGIEIPLTTYVARHSWATIAKNEGAPIAAISEGLGHTTEKTTQIYLRAFDSSVIDKVNEKVVSL